MDGILNVLKPPGITSTDVVTWVKRRLHTKTGHGGTLDPGAAGVLPICVGKATRLFDILMLGQKEYIAGITFGMCTDTQDAYGKIVHGKGVVAADGLAIQQVLPQFTGEIQQIPPRYSALKIAGQSAYDLARKGQDFALHARPATIHQIELLGTNGAEAMVRVVCGKGTYIRTLAQDIGEALGCGAYLSFLLRTKAHGFFVEDAFTLEELELAIEQNNLPLILLDDVLADYPISVLNPRYEKQAANGNALLYDWFDVLTPQQTRVYCNNRLYALASPKPETKQLAMDIMLV